MSCYFISIRVALQVCRLASKNICNIFAQAAGLGHGGILKYILERYPQGINDVDNDGRTPLHYAAIVKDDQHTYNTLISAGADESAVDNVRILFDNNYIFVTNT